MNRSTPPRAPDTVPDPREFVRDALEAYSEKVLEASSIDDEAAFEKKWLTNEEAMEYLGLSRSTLHRWRKSGKIPYSKVGRNVYYRLEDIREMLEENLR